MTYADRETSAHAGEPVELYRFNIGTTEWLQTSADSNFPLQGKTYVATYIERGQLSVTDETPREALEVTVARDNPVAALFNAQAPDGTLYLTIYREHRGTVDFITLGKWRVLGVAWANSMATLKCEPVFTALARPMLRMRYSVTCRHALFDAGCGVSKSSYAVTATVIDVAGPTMQASAFADFDDGYFRGGELDAGGGRRRRIIDHVGDTITLTANIPGVPAGAPVTVYPSCNKIISGDCTTKFANTPNHGGFPNIPDKNPFETGVQ